jgi:branched-chain amino acid aminotransferase
MSFVWLNGEVIDESAAHISVRDTGLLHAIGLFTTMRAASGNVIELSRHLQRLRDSCDALFVPLQYSNEVLAEAVSALLTRSDVHDARLRFTITRGVTQPDPLHGQKMEPTALLTATPFEPYPVEYYEKGLTVMVLDDQKLNPYDVQAGHKTLNYFSRLSALKEAARRGAAEAMWFNVHNYLQSGSISNVFIVKDGTLYTPPTNDELHDESIRSQTPYVKSNVLPGTTRAAIIDIARAAEIPVRIHSLTISDLLDADEVFLTNSVMGVMPVCRVERKPIANDIPGPITGQLREQWESRLTG